MKAQSGLEESRSDFLIDISTKEPIDKEHLLHILKSHKVKTASIENADVPLEEVIPSLRKAKVYLNGQMVRNILVIGQMGNKMEEDSI